MIDGAGALLAQVSSTLDAADRLGRAPASVILAAVVLVLAGALVVTVREVMRLHTARLADAAARHADAERHSAEKFSQAERHAGEMLALQGQMIPKIAEVTEAATALSGVAEALTDARETFDRATPLSTHAPPPRASRGAKP